MSTEPKRPRGRPPREAGGPGVYQPGVRFNDQRKEQMLRAVEQANDRCGKAGVPANVTASGLVAMWIGEHLDASDEDSKRGRG